MCGYMFTEISFRKGLPFFIRRIYFHFVPVKRKSIRLWNFDGWNFKLIERNLSKNLKLTVE